ncbi:hypothetical protein SAY87_017379 [Trapa incisa]|uniref:EF-hand domain-containing protein n=1 Tax=Trapa incisa TaxID=236973 RepID=A0AAN7L2Y8_9MYRT|nr:hypothetical protein SAY87_017379 [Trapa incisa]
MLSFPLIVASLLFVASLLNLILKLGYPTKKLLGWFQSLVSSPNKSTSSTDVAHVWSTQKSSSLSKEISSTQREVDTEESNERSSSDGSDKIGRGFDEQRKMLFSTFDRNGDGFITRQELRDSLRGIRIFLSDDEVDQIVSRSDLNGDGLIDFEEFCKLLEDSSMGFGQWSQGEVGGGGGDVDGGLKEAFDVFDKDKDGLISVEELGSVMCSLGLISESGKKVEDCKEMIRKVDMDGDGMVNFDEFKRMMMIPAGGGKSLIAVC